MTKQRLALNSKIPIENVPDRLGGQRELILNAGASPSAVGSAALFSGKSMVHKDPVLGGTRYALVGVLGYATYDACRWYDTQLEEHLHQLATNTVKPTHDSEL